ncbi:EYxxD motif small membrane protein [Bacillus sp. Marseille-Q3570]
MKYIDVLMEYMTDMLFVLAMIVGSIITLTFFIFRRRQP